MGRFSRFFRGGFAVAAIVVGLSPAGAQTVSQTPPETTTKPTAVVKPPFRPSRADEDYGYLSDPANRDGIIDRLKYIRLRKNRPDWYVSLGGEVRPYYEYYENFNFGRGPQDQNGYVMQRYMLHADFRFGKRVRVFVQFKSGLANQKTSPLIPPDVNKADVNAFFVDFNFGVRKPAAGNREPVNSFGYLPPRLTVRVGRQELNFGSGRLVSFRNGPNVRQTHDGVSVIWRTGKWRIDAVATKPVEDDPGYFDDEPRRDQTFWGVYATRPLTVAKKRTNADFYYLGFDRKNGRFDQGTARDIRQTVGARFWSSGRKVDYDIEFTGQFGRFGDGTIRAWAVSPSFGYTLANTKFRPRIGIDAGIVSGDRDPRGKNLNTFSPPFPRGQYFGLSAANGPLNVQGFRPSVRLALNRSVTIGAGQYFFWRQSRNDGLYNVGGALIRNNGNSRAWFIGQSFETEFAWQIDRHSSIQAGTSVFFTGRFLRETGPGETIKVAIARYTFLF